MNLPVNYDELHFSQRRVVRERYVELQKGLCAHCGEPLNGAAHKDVLKNQLIKNSFQNLSLSGPCIYIIVMKLGSLLGQFIVTAMQFYGSITENKF